MNQQAIIQILVKRYEEKRQKRATYSYHSYAKHLGVSSGALSSILGGQRKITKKMAQRFATSLGLEEAELKAFFDESQASANDLEYIKVQMDQFKSISEWQHFAILSLIQTVNFTNDVEWIARRLGIGPQKVENSIQRLVDLGMLINENGHLKRAAARYTTSDNIASASLKQAHRSNLELATNALDEVSLELRDFMAMTSAVDPTKIADVKKLIREFRDKVSVLLDEGERTEVYKLCIQFFPLTKQESLK